MQQLLGDTPRLPDEAFVCELFLQRLPPNVRMVLASARQDTSLEELAQMADKIVEVATPSVSAVNNIPSSILPQSPRGSKSREFSEVHYSASTFTLTEFLPPTITLATVIH